MGHCDAVEFFPDGDATAVDPATKTFDLLLKRRNGSLLHGVTVKVTTKVPVVDFPCFDSVTCAVALTFEPSGPNG